MPSPFPGMDPWLEEPTGWGGVHAGLLVACQAELNRVLPAGFVARIDEYVWVRDADGADLDPQPRVRHLQIRTARGAEVLTVVELLSPKNKAAGDGRDAYAQKRREYLATVNLVEVDLLRAGNRFPMGRPAPPAADYYVVSCRRTDHPAADVWALTVRDRLPVVAVPVAADRPDAPLDLQAAFDRVYDDGRYAETAGYDAPPDPPLRPADAEWAAQLLPSSPTTPARKRK